MCRLFGFGVDPTITFKRQAALFGEALSVDERTGRLLLADWRHRKIGNGSTQPLVETAIAFHLDQSPRILPSGFRLTRGDGLVFLLEPVSTVNLKVTLSLLCLGVSQLAYLSEYNEFSVLRLWHHCFRLFLSRVRRAISARIKIQPSPSKRHSIEEIGTEVQSIQSSFEKGEPAGARSNTIMLAGSSLYSGGAERQLVYTANGLLAAGFQVECLLESLSPLHLHDFYLSELSEGVSLRELRAYSTNPSERVLEISDAAFEHKFAAYDIERALGKFFKGAVCRRIALAFLYFRQARPAVVHSWLDEPNVVFGLAALIARVPRIVLGLRNVAPIHFAYYTSWMKIGYETLAGDPSVTFVNNSEAGRASYEEWLGLPKGKIGVVRNAVKADGFVPASKSAKDAWRRENGVPLDSRVVGSLMRLDAEKDPLLWIQVASLVLEREPDTHFVLIGSGSLARVVRRYVRRFRLGSKLSLLPPTSESALALSSFDILLMTSRFEGTPNTLLEAQLLGVPLVATGVGGVPEAVSGAIGEVVSGARSAELLAAAVVRQLRRLPCSDAERSTAKQFVSDNFSYQRMIEKTLGVYGV